MKIKKEKKNGPNVLLKILVTIIFISFVGFIINIAPNYIRKEIKDKINVIINNNNVTESLKFDAFLGENDIIYLSTKDIANFFDEDIYYDNKYEQIITSSDTKIATLKIDEKEMYVNSSKVRINGPAIKKDNNFYLPFSEMKTVYNIDVNYIKDSNIIVIDSLNREQKMGTASKNSSIKYMPTTLSKTVDNLKKGDSFVIIGEEKGFIKVRTLNGKIGYTKSVTNERIVREEMKIEKQIEGKVSLVWDYYSEYVSAPDRSGTSINGVNVVSPAFAIVKKLGKGDIETNIGEKGQQYINWAHNNGYKVWPMISNNSMKETTSEILNDYKLREKLINNIVNLCIEYDIDGINIDFENIYKDDKDMFTRFIIELAPRLKEYGKVLSVDVTAPDGSDDWSLCYNRYKIAKNSDYIAFMAYDQNGATSPVEGTTAGANWVEANIQKFLGQEEVPADKLILGMPFYTRLWKGSGKSSVVSMKNIDTVIPQGVEKIWDENLKQYYVEYNQNGTTYKMWLEEETSINAKFDLLQKYNLAGASYWAKDMEKPTIWDIATEKLSIK